MLSILKKTTDATSSADAFIPEIREAILEATRSEGTAKAAAIRCGHLLIKAKENIKAEKGRWLDWLARNDIPQTTASLYRRLAENEPAIAAAKSIREAEKTLRTRERGEGESSSTVASQEPKPTKKSPDVATLPPDEVFNRIRDRWTHQQLAALTTLLANHLSALEAAR